MIDLDANATTAMAPEVVDAMLPWLRDNHANPSGSYRKAKIARKAIEEARGKVADLIGAEEDEIVFTGSGTESVNTALHSLDVLSGKGKAVSSAIEHSAVLRYLDHSHRKFDLLPVGEGGAIDLEQAAEMLGQASYVSTMLANNETGVIQPVKKLAEMAKGYGLPVHSDAVQAVGKIGVNVGELGVDMLSLSAHKFHGPKGIGALFVRKGLSFSPYLYGGGQEKGRRSGTENTAAIVAMGKAAELAKAALEGSHWERIAAMRTTFEKYLLENVSDCQRNGDPNRRLPNTTHLSFAGCDAAGLLILLDQAGVACSAGSACMTGKQKPSHVQLAMGIPAEQAKTSLRFSFSRMSKPEDGLEAARLVENAVKKLREVQGSGVGPVVIYSD